MADQRTSWAHVSQRTLGTVLGQIVRGGREGAYVPPKTSARMKRAYSLLKISVLQLLRALLSRISSLASAVFCPSSQRSFIDRVSGPSVASAYLRRFEQSSQHNSQNPQQVRLPRVLHKALPLAVVTTLLLLLLLLLLLPPHKPVLRRESRRDSLGFPLFELVPVAEMLL